MDTGHQSIARAEHPPVGAEMVQRRRDRSGFFGKMLVTHTDKYTGTKRIVPVFLSRRERLLKDQLPGGQAGIPGSGYGGQIETAWELRFQAPQYQRSRSAQWGVGSLLP